MNSCSMLLVRVPQLPVEVEGRGGREKSGGVDGAVLIENGLDGPGPKPMEAVSNILFFQMRKGKNRHRMQRVALELDSRKPTHKSKLGLKNISGSAPL